MVARMLRCRPEAEPTNPPTHPPHPVAMGGTYSSTINGESSVHTGFLLLQTEAKRLIILGDRGVVDTMSFITVTG